MNPSLLLIPDRYKASKLYSQIPDSGAGDLAFTRANDTATRVNSAGLIEKVRTNLALYSQDFTNAAWFKEAGNSATGNTIANPLNGATDADTITATDTNAMNVNQLFTAAATSEHTYSIYLKKNNHDLVQPYIFSSSAFAARIEINLNDGTFTTINGSGATVTSVGNGWYRITLIASLSSAATFATGVLTSSTTGSRSVYVFGVQVETGVATPYIPTTTAAVSVGPVANIPRIDYTGGGCGKLLLEPQRTNNITYSEQLNNAAWTLANSGSASAAVVTANYGISPDGTQNADRVQFSRTGTTSSDYSLLDRSTISTAAGVVSFYGKSLSGTQSILLYYGSVGQVFTLTTEWQRFSLYDPTTTTDLTIGTRGGSGNYFNGGSLTIDCLLWGFQKEAGSYATSYINTLGASVTRSADAASKTGISSLIGVNGGSIFVELDAKGLGAGIDSSYIFDLSDGTNFDSNRIAMYWGVTSNDLRLFYGYGGTFSESIYNFNFLTTKKIGVRWTSTQIQVVVNGVAQTALTYGNSSPTKLNIASRFNDAEKLYSNIKVCALYNNALSTAELQTLTTL